MSLFPPPQEIETTVAFELPVHFDEKIPIQSGDRTISLAADRTAFSKGPLSIETVTCG